MSRVELLINHIRDYIDSGMWKYEACNLSKDDLELILESLKSCKDCINYQSVKLLQILDKFDELEDET